MTDYNDNSKLKHDAVSNMEALKTVIVNDDEQRLKALMTNLLFDEIQKKHLINLAKHHGNPEIVKLLKGVPAIP